MKDWLKKNKGVIGRTLTTIVLSIAVSLGTVYGIFCWYYNIDPSVVTRHFEIRTTDIVGPGSVTEDGRKIHGFTLYDADNNVEYLVTDYWGPIALVDDAVEIPES